MYRNLQVFFAVTIFFGLYLLTKEASNTNVLIYRFALIIIGIIGSVGMIVYKKKKGI